MVIVMHDRCQSYILRLVTPYQADMIRNATIRSQTSLEVAIELDVLPEELQDRIRELETDWKNEFGQFYTRS